MAGDHNNLHNKVLALVRQDLIGPAKGKGIVANLVTEDDDIAVYAVALVALLTSEDEAMDRHLIRLHKKTGNVLSTKPVAIEHDEMKGILLDNKLGTLKAYQRLNNGSYGTTYKVTVEEPDKPELIVQLRFHGNVSSMNALQDYIRARAPSGLRVPKTFSANSSARHDELQLQITEFVPGAMGDAVFKHLSIEDKVPIVRHMARAFAAQWELPIEKKNNDIGQAVASFTGNPDDLLTITVGPEKQGGVGGPFDSVSSFLKAWILHRFEKLEVEKGIDEYEAMLLPAIRDFVHNKLDSRLPKVVDRIPVVLMHTDLGLHNVLLSQNPPFDLAAVIDWEFTSCLPFLCAVPRPIERMLREGLGGGEAAVLEAVQLLREAFWNEIPAWRDIMASTEGQTFLEWYEFGLYMKANVYMKWDASLEEKMMFWERNISVVERFLAKWGQGGPSP